MLQALNHLIRKASVFLLFLSLFLLHSSSFAQWDNPETDDPCDDPWSGVNCGNALDMGNMASAAEAAYEQMEEDAESYSFPALLLWMAENLGPNVPTDPNPPEDPKDPEGPEDGGPEDPKDPTAPGGGTDGGTPPPTDEAPTNGGEDAAESQSTSTSGYSSYTYYVEGRHIVKKLRKQLDRMEKGKVFKPFKQQDSKWNTKLVGKYERNPNNREEFTAIFALRQKDLKGSIKKHNVYITGHHNRLYFQFARKD